MPSEAAKPKKRKCKLPYWKIKLLFC
jgi:hypothetical protein